jgi:hypothetical protein
MAPASTSHATCASSSTTAALADVLKESEESKDFELEDDFVAHAKYPISSSGDEFDD